MAMNCVECGTPLTSDRWANFCAAEECRAAKNRRLQMELLPLETRSRRPVAPPRPPTRPYRGMFPGGNPFVDEMRGRTVTPRRTMSIREAWSVLPRRDDMDLTVEELRLRAKYPDIDTRRKGNR
jgi:hypothetical protein